MSVFEFKCVARSRIGLISDLLRVLVIVGVIFYTSNDALIRFGEFANSENPVRNRVVFFGIWGLTLYVVIATAFLKSIKIRLIYSTIVGFSTLASEIYKKITNGSLSYGDLYSLWIARADYKSALDNYWYSSLSSFAVFFLIWLAMVVSSDSKLKGRACIKFGQYVFFIPFVALVVMIAQKGGAAAIGMPEQIRSISMFVHILYFESTNNFDSIRVDVDVSPVGPQNKRPHIVLIVDESVRGDFLSINNRQERTTPFIESVADSKIINFGYASTTHDCSHYANANLRYGTHSLNLKNSLLINPSIWDYAKIAGYETTYLDAQRRHGQLQNLMSPRERRAIDNFIQFDDVDAVERGEYFVQKDRRAAHLLAGILKETKPQLVLLNKEGAHAPYEGKYPQSETKFLPTMALGESIHPGLSREKLLNSYRNAISWGVDKFFEKLLKEVSDESLNKSVIIYTADHGQNLLEKGTATHCGSSSLSDTVGLVPLFFVSTNPFVVDDLRTSAKVNFNKASHFNIFPSMLMLMGYQPDQSRIEYDKSLFEELPDRRVWFTGDILHDSARKHFFVIPEKLVNHP